MGSYCKTATIKQSVLKERQKKSPGYEKHKPSAVHLFPPLKSAMLLSPSVSHIIDIKSGCELHTCAAAVAMCVCECVCACESVRTVC